MSDLIQPGDDRLQVALTSSEFQRLIHLERKIEEGKKIFIDVAEALYDILYERLYREKYSSFGAYLRDRWGLSRSRGYQLIDAAKLIREIKEDGATGEGVSTAVDTPTNESQARAIMKAKRQAKRQASKPIPREPGCDDDLGDDEPEPAEATFLRSEPSCDDDFDDGNHPLISAMYQLKSFLYLNQTTYRDALWKLDEAIDDAGGYNLIVHHVTEDFARQVAESLRPVADKLVALVRRVELKVARGGSDRKRLSAKADSFPTSRL